MKKLISITAAVLSAIALCASASAEQCRDYGVEFWKEYIRMSEEEDEETLRNFIWDHEDDGGPPYRWLDTEYFTSETNYIIKVKFSMNPYFGNENYDDNYSFFFALTDGTEYRAPSRKSFFYERERNCCTTAEILEMSGIPDADMIFKAWMYFNNGCDCDADLESIDFYPCINGWNTIDGEQYYVKSDGILATKSMTIGGIRYKFAKSGICEGKYTGWTKSSKGKRYWKNGELQKNKTLKTKSGKVYRLDKNGYATLKA